MDRPAHFLIATLPMLLACPAVTPTAADTDATTTGDSSGSSPTSTASNSSASTVSTTLVTSADSTSASGETSTPTSEGPATSDSSGTDDTGGPAQCDEDLVGGLPLGIEGSTFEQGDDFRAAFPCMLYPGGEDYAYAWTVPEDGLYRFLVDAYASFAVLDGCDDAAVLFCDDPAREVGGLFLTAGQELGLLVDSYDESNALGWYALTIERTECDPPIDIGSDLSTEPIVLDGGDDLSGTCGYPGEDVVVAWTAPTTALYRFAAIGDVGFVYAFAGTCGDSRDEIGCAYAGTGGFVAAVQTGEVVQIVLDGGDTGEESLGLEITEMEVALAGDCCATDDSPGCIDVAVTNCVCGRGDVPLFAADSLADCCDVAWGPQCAAAAATLGCDAACPTTTGGSCCVGVDLAPDPGCDVESIETCVCAGDPLCCGEDGWGWDSTCVYTAQLTCGAEC